MRIMVLCFRVNELVNGKLRPAGAKVKVDMLTC